MTRPDPAQIRTARESSGLSQTAAAALIHCSRSSWAEWEGGVSKMHPAFWELFQIKTNHQIFDFGIINRRKLLQ